MMSSHSESICGATWPEDPNLVCVRPPGHKAGHSYADPPIGYGSGGVISAEAARQMTASIEANTGCAAERVPTPITDEDMVPATWEGLMTILDTWYPPEVFDGSSGDLGARIVVLARELAKCRAALDAALNGGE